jgi:hypothetical protein
MIAIVAIVFFLAGCAASPSGANDPLPPLGGPVADSRRAPSEFVPLEQLDHPPQKRPSMEDRFGDPITRILRSTGPQTVVAVLLVDEEGRVVDVIVRKAGYAYFAERVRVAAKAYRFEPARFRGHPARWQAEMPFEFR